MDKLKTGLEAAKKYNFWVLTVVLLLAALGSWFVATAGIFKQVGTREGELSSHFSALSEKDKPDLPNDGRIESIELKHEQLVDKVYEAWEWLKKEQADKNKLSKKLSKEFRDEFEKLKPGRRLSRKSLENYHFFIRNHFPELFKDIGIRLPVEGESEAGTAANGGGFESYNVAAGDVKMVGIVDWNDSDRQRVVGRFSWGKRPSTREVLLAQEDLWVYEALLRAIKKTNGNVTEQYNAPIVAINALEIGREASNSCLNSGQIIMDSQTGTPGATSGAGRGDYGDFGDYGGFEGFEGPSGDPAAMGGLQDHSQELSDPTLLEWRYVGPKSKPLGAKEPHPYAEFKMMPIRMSLLMDQTAIPKLLVACANSNMPIEILKVRLRPGEAHDLGLTAQVVTEGGRSGLTSGDSFEGGYPGMAHGGGFRGGRRSYTGSNTETAEQALYAPVELQGIIYIFNPPDKDKLGTGTAAEDQPQPPTDTPPEGETSPADAVIGDNSTTNP